MDTIWEMLSRGVEELLGRASGPLHFRLVMMPTVVTVLAIRAGVRDAREATRGFPREVLRDHSAKRQRFLRSALKDIGRVVVVAVVVDTIYQLVVFRAFHAVQLLIVVVACAILPYVLIRGPVARIARHLS